MSLPVIQAFKHMSLEGDIPIETNTACHAWFIFNICYYVYYNNTYLSFNAVSADSGVTYEHMDIENWLQFR